MQPSTARQSRAGDTRAFCLLKADVCRENDMDEM